ncbi:MAG TPA: glycosyltransferase family 1 protein, partial [Saprospiraceae bacterium]|nr:glycosyltransferase family 1 protein [Saprospiraceae bacterium]
GGRAQRRAPQQERPPIKVLLEAQKLADPQRDGINRYVYALCNAMRYLQKERSEFRHVHVDLLVGGAIVPLHQDLKVSSNELKGAQSPDWVAVSKNTFKKLLPGFIYRPLRRLYLESPARLLLEKQRLLMRLIREYKNLKSSRRFFAQYDLIHVTLPQHYQYFRLLQHNFVVTVHDLTHKLFPEFHLKSNVRNAERGMDFIKKKNAAVIAVSEATKADLIEIENIENQRIKVILEAADRERFNRIYDENTAANVLKKYGLEGQVYFFSLATLEPRKNLRNTLRAFLKLKEKYPGNPVKFALAGKTGWKEKPDYPDHPDILPLGYVNDEDLSALFTAAFGFCYVSHYEGFGLPLLEAMRCGLPV